MSDHFKVLENAEFGRYSCATKNISAGEVIFEEYPFVVGPKPNTPPVCLGCCCPLDGSADGPRCPPCRWPLCENCNGNDLHRDECRVFVECKVYFQDFPSLEEPCMQLDCITPLRFLLQKEVNPKRWDAEIALMEHHVERRRLTEQWNADQQNVVQYLCGPCKLQDRFSEELIQQVCGILEVNAFEARTTSGYNVRCIFPKTAIMAHSCVPNTSHSIHPSNEFKIVVRASININQDDILHTTYTNLLDGTSARQTHLKSSKFFVCRCERCNDPTELKTHFSSLKCSKCDLGLVCISDPNDIESMWKCSRCDFNTNATAVQRALSIIQTEVDAIQSMDFSAERLEKCEQLFRKYRSVFHPQHYIQTGLRQNLIEMYGRVEGYELQDLPDVMLEHKIDLCRQVLNVLNVIHPGKTRCRAMLMYELHAPLVLIARSAYAAGVLQGDALKSKLQEAVDLLEECTPILEWEDSTTVEYTIGRIARESLAQLKESMRAII
ncbi:SET domain-containing protein SmydA-8-like [Bradysia coprophila]|uniref:SET domain-containing protein SmydA-8-like n=1 Tax=Bradysia coprophila TaxID=38358 RepID=UPI00187D7979|nr:SET domain-containing protein SmydA-8-like [Bradysia coprophila]